MNELNHKLSTLTMKPEDWTKLSRLVDETQYRQMVNEYQKREEEQLPKCKCVFGLCRSFSFGKCTCKNHCSNKIVENL